METHELRLAINAAAAKAGGAQFVAAIRRVQIAVRDLERDAAGGFKQLRESAKEAASAARDAGRAVGESTRAARRGAGDAASASRRQGSEAQRAATLQLQLASAMRASALEAERLRGRLLRSGDQQGAMAVTQALTTLRAQTAGGVASTLQLRQAMDQFGAATNRAKITLAQQSTVQAQAAGTARRLANEQRSAADAARKIEAELRSVSAASHATSRAIGQATGNMRGLENAFNGTFQAGTLFRTLIGSISLGQFTRSVFQAGDALDQFRVTMEVSTGSARGSMEELEFIDDLARRLGTNLDSSRDAFAKFGVSASIAGVESEQTRAIFESVSTAMAVLGKNTEDQRLAFLALEQMMSKGVISAEELRRQLGERLPGAVNLMAQAVGVSTSELQKLLKEGKLISSEVLPKFAEKLQEVFGPGLAAAQRRAGNNLQKLQTEFSKFLEAISQGGFMDQLALEFRKLTDLMRSSDTQEAARKLGQGFGEAARLVGVAAKFIVENINEIGAVTKAVVGGLIARQAILMVNAFVTMGQQIAAFVAQLGGQTVAATSATAATNALTLAMEANTLALAGQATASGAATTGITGTTLAFDQELRSAVLADGANKRATAGFIGLGGGARIAAGGLAFASRGLLALAGPIGIIVAAISVLPLLFSDFGSAAEDAAGDVDAALRRAGVALDDFEARLAETTGNVRFTGLINDINDMEAALGGFKDQPTNFLGFEIDTTPLEATTRAMRLLRGETLLTKEELDRTGGILMGMEGISLRASAEAQAERELGGLGFSSEDFEGISGSLKDTLTRLLDLTAQATQTKSGFLELAEEIQSAIRLHPAAKELLQGLDEFAKKNALIEQGIARNRARLVEFYGTRSERAVAGLAEMAVQTVRTGKGIGELQKKLREETKVNPEAAAELQRIMQIFDRAVRTGQSAQSLRLELFSSSALPSISRISGELDTLRGELTDTQKRSDAATKALSDGLNDVIDAADGTMLGRAVAGIDITAILDGVREKTEELADSARVGFGDLTRMADAFTPSGARAAFFADAMSELTSELATGTIGFGDFEDKMQALNLPTERLEELRRALLEQATATRDSAVTTAQFAEHLDSLADLGVSADVIQLLKDRLLPLASATVTAGKELSHAAASVDGFGAAARRTEEDAKALDRRIRELAGAFDTLSSAEKSIRTLSGDSLKELSEKVNISGISDERQRSVAEFFATFGEGGKVLAKIDAEIARTEEALASASLFEGAEGDLRAQMATLFELRRAYRTNAEEFVLALTDNKATNKASKKKDDLTKALERLQKKAQKTETALLGMAQATDILQQGLDAKKITAEEAAKVLSGLALNASDNIAKEEDLGKRYLTSTEILSMNVAQREALRQSRIVESALASLGIDLLDKENAALAENIQKKLEAAAANEMRVAARNAIDEHIDSLKQENMALGLLINGQVESAEVADLMAAALIANGGVLDEQTIKLLQAADAAQVLNEAMSRAAKDPVKDWMDSVPNWEEATKKIETGAINALSDTIANFAKTGKMDFQSLGDSILSTATSIISDMAVKELLGLFGVKKGGDLFGGIFGGMDSGGGGPMQSAADSAAKSVGSSISDAFKGSGEEFSTSLTGVFSDASNSFGDLFGGLFSSIGSLFGGAGGGAGGGLFSSLLGGIGSIFGGGGGGAAAGTSALTFLPFKEGGISSAPTSVNKPVIMPSSLLSGAPSYANGTANTSGGIPALLHDNEAVVPLSGGRRIPVEMQGGGKMVQVTQNFNFPNSNPEAFRRSQAQVAADAANAGNSAAKSIR